MQNKLKKLIFLTSIGITISIVIVAVWITKVQKFNPDIISAANCRANVFSVQSPTGYNFTPACLSNGLALYLEDPRYIIFQAPAQFTEAAYIRVPNVSLKELISLNWSVTLNERARVYIFTRHIPGINQIPTWVSRDFSRHTNDDLSQISQYFLRKNDQGLIGLYDISSHEFNQGIVHFGSAREGVSTAYSMYTVAVIPLDSPSPTVTITPSPTPTPLPSNSPGQGIVFAGAGDIADSGGGSAKTAAVISALISQNPNTQVFALGDNSYGSYTSYFDKTWGAFKSRVNPVMGNHDSVTGYYNYFGNTFGAPDKLYYSKEIGSWHLIGLNSQIATTSSTDPQLTWLKQDLAAHANSCTIAMWHEPTYSTGSHQDGAKMVPYWKELYNAGAEIVLQSHTHIYERTKPLNAQGTINNPASQGMVSFVVGTGGNKGTDFNSDSLCTESSICASRHSNSSGFDGVLKLTLGQGNYSYEFLHVAGTSAANASFQDKGSSNCH